jgi:chemotaxis protein CheD
MGEIAVSAGGEELMALGLGSCIGLALVDRAGGIAGLAHIVLPESREAASDPGKFANLAVPELIERMRRAGASQSRLEAYLTGGARMFELGSELDIGARNEAAVRGALKQAQVEVTAAATGGNRGRTVKITAGDCTVTVREAGGDTMTLSGQGAGMRLSRSSMAGTRA